MFIEDQVGAGNSAAAASPLSERRRRFVQAYLLDPNATQAAISAGYSRKTAHAQGSRLLKKAEVRAELHAASDERERKTGIDAAWHLAQLAKLYAADIADAFTDGWTLKPIHEMPKALVRQIESITISEVRDPKTGELRGRTSKIRLVDRPKVLEQIGKHVQVGEFRERAQLGDLPSYEQSLSKILTGLGRT